MMVPWAARPAVIPFKYQRLTEQVRKCRKRVFCLLQKGCGKGHLGTTIRTVESKRGGAATGGVEDLDTPQ